MRTYIHRDIEPTLIRAVKTFSAVALTGPRQSGKSTLLRRLFSKTHRYVTLDDPQARDLASRDPQLFLNQLRGPAIIDEIQYAPELMPYIKMRIDEHRSKKGSYILTGSQQFTMMRHLTESLAGRVALFDLLPFSWFEKRTAKSSKRLITSLGGFVHACLKGSFPETTTLPVAALQEWYASYVNTYLEKDVRGQYDIGNLRDFQRFIQLLAARTAQILNCSSFANDLGVSVTTVKRWLSVLEAGRIVYLLQPFYENFGKRIIKMPKVYFLDCGLAAYLSGIRTEEHLMKGPMAGALFETFCLQETFKMLLAKGGRPQLFYLRTNNDLEVDLLIRIKNGKWLPVEIKMSQTPKPSMASGILRFKQLFDKLPTTDGVVVTLADREFPLSASVNARPLEQYLRDLDS
jgi:hypothetical protein